MDSPTTTLVSLRGQLDPASINGWFRDWWPRLFAQFDFEAGCRKPAEGADAGEPR